MTVPASFDRLDPEQRRRVTRAVGGGQRRAGAAFDVAVVVFWFVLAPFLLRSLLRARRAIAANGPPAG